MRYPQDIRLSKRIMELFNNSLNGEYYFIVPEKQIKFNEMDARDFYNCVALMRANQRLAVTIGDATDAESIAAKNGAAARAKFFEGIIDTEISRVNTILLKKCKE